MKLHYKSLLVEDPRDIEYFGNETKHLLYHKLHRHNQPNIEYCCEEMKSAINESIFGFENIGHKQQDMGLLLKISDYGEGLSNWYYHVLKFCPFCGERIEYVEDYKAKIRKRKITIKQKTIPAYTETKNIEIKYKKEENA